MLEIRQALADFVDNPDTQTLILTGSGRFFCFGADFMEFQNRSALADLLELFQNLILKLYHTSKITIACLNGFATGAGLDLALACDFRTAAEKIKLGEAYIGMGLVPDGGGSFLLPRLIGSSRAMEMFMTGEAVTAEDALSVGLVHRIFPQEELLSRTIEFANQLASKPATARHHIKRLLKEPALTLQDALRKEREAQLLCFADPEHIRLAEEFLNKRKKS